MLHKLWIPAIPNGRTRSKFIEHWEHGEYTWKTSTRRLDLRRFKTLDLWPKHSILRHYGMAMVGKSLHMSMGQLKIRECQVTCGGLCNILASQQSPEQNFGHFPTPAYYFPRFLGYFKTPAQILPLSRKSMVPKVAPYLPEWPKKAGGRLTDGEKWQFFLGLRRRGQHRPRHTECVLYAPLVAWWWPGCTRAR